MSVDRGNERSIRKAVLDRDEITPIRGASAARRAASCCLGFLPRLGPCESRTTPLAMAKTGSPRAMPRNVGAQVQQILTLHLHHDGQAITAVGHVLGHAAVDLHDRLDDIFGVGSHWQAKAVGGWVIEHITALIPGFVRACRGHRYRGDDQKQ